MLNGNSNIEGEIELKIYFESEEKIGLEIKTITIPFISKISESNDPISRVDNLEFDFDNNFVFVKGQVSIIESNFSKNRINIVQDVTQKEVTNSDDYSIVIYSVKQNDTLWDVSKKFKVRQENVISSNNLEEPYLLNPGEKIYIVR